MLAIRNEAPADYQAVEDLTRRAFYNLYVPGCHEHYLVHVMRDHPDFLPELDFVLELDGEVIGSILYTRSTLTGETVERRDILTFGPVCVAPEHQRKGFGKALMEHSFRRAEALGYDVIVIFGSPANYVARGFKSCKRYGVCSEDGRFPAAMMVKELVPGVLDGRRRTYHGSPVMEVSEAEAERYDGNFDFMEKKYRPGQEEFFIMSQAFLS